MFATPAYAATTGASAAGAGLAGFASFAPLILIFVVGYFLLIRPQQQRAKAHQMTIEAVKKGDSVVTAGGIAGKVTKVEDRFVEVEIAPTVKVRVVKATLAEVNGGNKPADA